jgi:hypothetical protein
MNPFQGQRMVTHLIEIQRSMLSDLWNSSERCAVSSTREQNSTVEFAPRYFLSACRDLHRSIDRHMEMKKKNRTPRTSLEDPIAIFEDPGGNQFALSSKVNHK